MGPVILTLKIVYKVKRALVQVQEAMTGYFPIRTTIDHYILWEFWF